MGYIQPSLRDLSAQGLMIRLSNQPTRQMLYDDSIFV
jgi:hypothetical protein